MKTIIRQAEKAEIRVLTIATSKGRRQIFEICITMKDEQGEEVEIYYYVKEISIGKVTIGKPDQ